MKFKVTFVLVILLSFHSVAQETSSKIIKQTIEDFFKGFHARDSVVIKRTLGENFTLQTIRKDTMGSASLKTTSSSMFFQNIAGIPSEVDFEEKLLSFTIDSDGLMAHVWTPYEFWFGGKFSHCGVNSFHLMNTNSGWRIISILDTRYVKGCK
ncbi:nuclear transport factor 2 family protein [Ascidiimonas sp. W6]|uniref:nuclear transport factor 2 family protein n=1 Tax=Ascidiimonas meishanensis TaxID=3128903 RepID=UPI0030EF8208